MRRTRNWILLAVALALLAPASDETQAQNVQPKSPALAFALSGLGTLLPTTVVYYRLTDGTAGLDGVTFAILSAGSIVGPSLGHFYTENYDRAWGGITFRLVAGLAGTAGAYAGIFMALSGGNPTLGALLLAGGIIVVGTSAMLDIVRAPASAQAWNDRYGIAVYPSFHPHTSGYGAAISFSF